MITGPIIWSATIQNAINSDHFGFVDSWMSDIKTGYAARLGYSEYKDWINGERCKYFPYPPTDYDISQFKEYKKTV